MDKELAKRFIDLALEHAEWVGKIYGNTEADFYEALKDVYSYAERFGVPPSYFRDRALAIEKRFVRRQIKNFLNLANECLKRGDYVGYAAYILLKNRQEDFRQTQKSTGKTAVELGEKELIRRMTICIPAEALENDAVVYAMIASIAPPPVNFQFSEVKKS